MSNAPHTIAVIGANGGIGRRLVSRLAEAGHTAIGVVRADDQFDRIREHGGEPRLGDLEGTIAPALDGADAVVFTAGSGGGTGWDKTILVDLWGAKRAVDACTAAGIDRFVMVSSRGADAPQAGREPLRPYLVAKHFADRYLRQSALHETILRPTRLTDDSGTGRVATDDGESIPRADVAEAIVACLQDDTTIGRSMELYGGDTPIAEAVRP
ncbi:MAG: SDR family oxidoreductase [Salinibacter sp.]